VNLALVNTDAGVGNLLIADVAGLLEFLVDTLDVLVQVRDGEGLAAVRALSALIVANCPAPDVRLYRHCLMCRERLDVANSFSQCGHGFLILTEVILGIPSNTLEGFFLGPHDTPVSK